MCGRSTDISVFWQKCNGYGALVDWRKGLKTRREGERERKRGQSRTKYRGKGEKNNLHGNVCNPWVKGESKERWGEGRERERESDCECECVWERERGRERKLNRICTKLAQGCLPLLCTRTVGSSPLFSYHINVENWPAPGLGKGKGGDCGMGDCVLDRADIFFPILLCFARQAQKRTKKIASEKNMNAKNKLNSIFYFHS